MRDSVSIGLSSWNGRQRVVGAAASGVRLMNEVAHPRKIIVCPSRRADARTIDRSAWRGARLHLGVPTRLLHRDGFDYPPAELGRYLALDATMRWRDAV